MSESDIQRAILDYLAARHILAFRQNTGAMVSEYKGRKRFMRFGTPGMADIVAFPHIPYEDDETRGIETPVIWIECKAAKGKQSEAQKSFQVQVEEYGHRYIVARSIEDVEAAL